jgi:hypothetical protein
VSSYPNRLEQTDSERIWRKRGRPHGVDLEQVRDELRAQSGPIDVVYLRGENQWLILRDSRGGGMGEMGGERRNLYLGDGGEDSLDVDKGVGGRGEGRVQEVHLVDHNSQGPQINTTVIATAEDEFWSQVL